MTLLATLLELATAEPASLFVRFDGRAHTYRDVADAARGFAGRMRTLGLMRGDRVALFHDNTPDFLAAYFGTWLAGGVVVLVNPAYKHTELRHILADSGARFCVTTAKLRPEVEALRNDLPDMEGVIVAPFSHAAGDVASAAGAQLPSANDLAIIAYTSGTTGRSKGAMLLHSNLLSNARAVVEAWRWTRSDHLLHMLPLFHAHGLMVGIHGTVVAGASLELHRAFDAATAFGRLCSGDFSMFFGVPTMYTRLIAEARNHPERPRALRLFVSGSAALSPQTFAEFEALFGARILERYGMTETIMNCTNPYDGERRPGTVGMPFPGQQARVVHVRTRQLLGQGESGEIEVRGPHVCAGYWQRPDATAESITPDGWFATGDLGQFSADGYLTINGRAKELIISGGYNIYPREVEEVIEALAGVREVAVLGLPDAEFGENVVAVVCASDPQLDGDTVIAHCRANLAGYKKTAPGGFRRGVAAQWHGQGDEARAARDAAIKRVTSRRHPAASTVRSMLRNANCVDRG